MGLHVVVVTGVSGAGRSTALHVLEDLGFYCVDNLPPSLVTELVEIASEGPAKRIALGVDIRTGHLLAASGHMLQSLRDHGHEVEVLFLECSDEVLLRRYSETRRPHPLAGDGNILSAIESERQLLSTLREASTTVVDTSGLSVHDLKRIVIDHLARGGAEWKMVLRVVSFGFKYGLPHDADLVFDLRHLPNPHHVEALRPLTGRDPSVADYVLSRPETQEYLHDVENLLEHAVPRYAREGKAYLTVAIGCTGGKHRSVALAEKLGSRFRSRHDVHVVHRDMMRGGGR